MKKFILFFIFILLFYSYLKTQNVINNSKQTGNINKVENYSKADWEGKGIFRNFKPENEIVELRTRTSKHFLNPDSTVTAILMAGSSINYEEDGKWQTVTREIENNNSGRYSQYPYSNTNNAFKSYYPASGGSDGILTIIKEGTINEWINPQMYYIVDGEKVNYQKINIADVQIAGNEIIYKNIYNNIDIKFIQNTMDEKWILF